MRQAYRQYCLAGYRFSHDAGGTRKSHIRFPVRQCGQHRCEHDEDAQYARRIFGVLEITGTPPGSTKAKFFDPTSKRQAEKTLSQIHKKGA